MKDSLKIAAIFAAGLIVGVKLEKMSGIKELKYSNECRDRNYDLYEKSFSEAEELRKEKAELALELRQCKMTNFQVATYATRLKKMLDEMTE